MDRLPVLSTGVRVLTFRATREELLRLDWRHLLFGLAFVWAAGYGRYWDRHDVPLAQHLGLGSVVYVFGLSAFLWLLLAPLRPRNWSYRRLLTYVTLSSPPALIYALPVEHWMKAEDVGGTRATFLFIVATWRVAMLVVYLRRVGELGGGTTFVATALPLMGVAATLMALNLDRATFDLMEANRGPNDQSYFLLVLITACSIYGVVPMLIAYLVLVGRAWRRTPSAEAAAAGPSTT